jgi:hypothetical protein
MPWKDVDAIEEEMGLMPKIEEKKRKKYYIL